ncbi:response regulator [Caenimonas aquaedulcis]|uniref:histidine kinase n=1 Tax=Caenimonas aquaedulcis TaxID=2793270 RepID=A0A931H4E5_9BURK|nr:response regulator [Caenimonas aquaedulcis]MBG9388420.1 response regulator [Caenimonas aquaedulcis]
MNPTEGVPAILEQTNILIVDDEPKNLVVLETVLDDPSYRLIRAGSGDEALMRLVQHEFAVLVLDVRMPGMNGFELAMMVKQRKKTASVPIIFLTAYYNEDQHILEGYGSGAVDYLHKPINASVLRSKVAVFAELYRRGRALEVANRALTLEVSERRRAQERLSELNESLDRRVQERTEALEKSESQLRDADRRKDEFLATLAHELRNPLAPVRTAAQLLQMPRLEPERIAWSADLIDRQVTVMSRLIDDLMDVSRINQGKIDLKRRKVRLADLLRDALEIARPLIDESGHEFHMVPTPEDMELDADPMRLSQAIMNLLNNAAKYTERGGRIEVAAVRRANNAVITVRDNGIGIPPERLDSVFEMFSQVDTALTRSRGGLGIGLALSRRLIEMHGGTLIASSGGPGEGSTFTATLPLLAQEAEAAPPPEKRTAAQLEAAAAPMKVLIADDNVDAADTLAMLIEMLGHDVRHVNDGEAAVDAAAKFEPRVALIDLGMPKLNGYEVCKQIRQLPNGKDVIVVAVTGWGQPDDRRRSAEAGFDRHLVKPVDPSALTQLLGELAQAQRNG